MQLLRPMPALLALLLFLASCTTAPEPAPKPESGSLDTSFGTDGLALAHFYADVTSSLSTLSHARGAANAVAVASDGKLVAAGRTGNGVISLARYNGDGTLDPTFDVDGTVVASLTYANGAEDMVVGADGKITIASRSYTSDYDMSVVRFNADGSPDTTFDSDGVATFSFGSHDFPVALAVDADGKPVVLGSAYDSSVGRYKYGVARFDADGTADTTFGGDGGVLVDVGTTWWSVNPRAVAVDADGKIVLVGSTYNSSEDFVVVRLNSDGSLDTGFGTDGLAFADFDSDDRAYSLTLDPAGKIVVAGMSPDPINHHYSFAVARFNADGSLDTTFAEDGTTTVRYPYGPSWRDGEAYTVAVDADGRVVLAGYMYDELWSQTITAARLNADGTLDTSFGEDGVAMHAVSTWANDQAFAVALDADGKIVLAGEAAEQFALMRLHP